MIFALDTVDFILMIIRHPSYPLVMLSCSLISPLLVSHIDLLNSVKVVLLALGLTLSQTLNLCTKGICLGNKLVLVAIVLTCILADLNGSVSDMSLQISSFNLGVS